LSEYFVDITTHRRLAATWQLQLFVREGIIYVQTRIPGGQGASSSLVLLPKSCSFVVLLIRYFHQQVMHGGLSLTLSKIRKQFWILCGRQAVKSVINKCVFCRRVKGKSYHYPLPPALPAFRSEGGAFKNVGVDYAGPFHVTTGKAYLLLFTCAVTRAIHLELTEDLTTDGFLLAMQRFVSRRGFPSILVSDNAKTFISSSIFLESIRSSTATVTYLAENRLKWVFNCSRASWWGGWFERLIGLIKDLMRKCLPKRKLLNATELATVFCNVEQILNNRPLQYVASNDTETVLTPSHFLCTSSDVSFPQNVSMWKLYTLKNELLSKFWLVFYKGYLAGLRERFASRLGSTGLLPTVGDVCLMYEPNYPQWQWPMVKVTQLLPSKDGAIRNAMVLNAKRRLVQRATSHLIPLEAMPIPTTVTATAETSVNCNAPTTFNSSTFSA
jgi:hypothetical protein